MATNEQGSLHKVGNYAEFLQKMTNCVRGETPEDIELKCLSLCRIYLSGIWLSLTVDDIRVKRLTGGLANQIYLCKVANPGASDGSVPLEVTIKFYGEIIELQTSFFEGIERLNSLLMAVLMSEHNLGPKLYGVFDEGLIQAYYEHRLFHEAEKNNPKLLDQLARRLAQFHAIEAPVRQNVNYILNYCKQVINRNTTQTPDMFVEYDCKLLSKCDFDKEIEWLEKCVQSSDSPIVFSHNDFGGRNILVTKPNDEIILCDFDEACYGYRGFDFSTIFVDWVKNDEKFEFPSDSLLKAFISGYISESVLLFGEEYSQNKCNSLEHILNETKMFVLVEYMFLSSMFTTIDASNDLPMDKNSAMHLAEDHLQNYYRFKNMYIEQNIVSRY